MAKAKEAEKLQEEVKEETVTEETVTEGTAEANDDGREDITVPIGVLTQPNDEHIPVCVNGKIYQVAVGQSVRVPKAVAEVLRNALAQKTKIDRMIKAKDGKSVEIQA